MAIVAVALSLILPNDNVSKKNAEFVSEDIRESCVVATPTNDSRVSVRSRHIQNIKQRLLVVGFNPGSRVYSFQLPEFAILS